MYVFIYLYICVYISYSRIRRRACRFPAFWPCSPAHRTLLSRSTFWYCACACVQGCVRVCAERARFRVEVLGREREKETGVHRPVIVCAGGIAKSLFTKKQDGEFTYLPPKVFVCTRELIPTGITQSDVRFTVYTSAHV